MEKISKLSEEVNTCLNNTGIKINEESSLIISEFIYDFCSWHIASFQEIDFNSKAKLKKAIQQYITN